MPTLRRQLRKFTWIALFAMLGLACVPAISHALNAGSAGEPWSVVCTSSGAVSGAPAAPLGTGMADRHCPLCVPHDGWVVLPSSSAAGLEFPQDAAFAVAPVCLPPQPALPWRAAPARAPPAIA